MDAQPWVGGAGCVDTCRSRSGSCSLGTRRGLRRPRPGRSVMFAPRLGGGAVRCGPRRRQGVGADEPVPCQGHPSRRSRGGRARRPSRCMAGLAWRCWTKALCSWPPSLPPTAETMSARPPTRRAPRPGEPSWWSMVSRDPGAGGVMVPWGARVGQRELPGPRAHCQEDTGPCSSVPHTCQGGLEGVVGRVLSSCREPPCRPCEETLESRKRL